MSLAFTTDNIDELNALRLNAPRGWRVTFRSSNDGLHHQLYVNGALADWTDTTEQRTFFVDAEEFQREVTIAAVDRDSRTVDMSDELSSEIQQPPWIHRALVVLSPDHRRGTRVAVLGDHATGQIDTVPLVIQELRPQWAHFWGFGEDRFGMGGLGYDADTAPGLGEGAFGAGPFGIEAELVSVAVPLSEEGTHQVLIRVISRNGEYTDGEIEYITSSPPPSPPTSLQAISYDDETSTLTLEIE